MNIFKALFGGRSSQAEEKKEEKNFEVLKYDGVRALKMQQFGYAVQCFLHALELNSHRPRVSRLSVAGIHRHGRHGEGVRAVAEHLHGLS